MLTLQTNESFQNLGQTQVRLDTKVSDENPLLGLTYDNFQIFHALSQLAFDEQPYKQEI